MTSLTTLPTTRVPIDHYSAVHLAAATTRSLAEQCRLPGAMPDRAAVIASELASNLDKHARDGALYIQPLPLGGGLEILAVDRGPGMHELHRCLTDGYTTTGTMGAGLGAVTRIATDFTIRTNTGADTGTVTGTNTETGTLACARIALPDRAQAARQEVGLVCLPADRELHCGDACAVVDTDEVRTAIVIDGLGHGPHAAEAAQTALRSFHAVVDRPLPHVLTAIHRSLRRTRGAAVGLLRLEPERAEYCGVGNVRAVALSPHQVHHRLTGRPGVVGWNIPAPQSHYFPLDAGTTAVLHSDGIDSRWTHTPSRFLLRLPPSLLVGAVAHGHRSTRDDAAVLAARPHQRHR
ncbi:SpoIIE family protein phosphatase [Streptomyces flavidovirens]|uniref:SpoIIE family protein phosphatase n=1 Tax=Streptomyces flavidovirens TaxID=67298 RepID=UPI00048FFE1B|nr:SpoIIE family protein phosphatase [Streptomyces flavidovirens]